MVGVASASHKCMVMKTVVKQEPTTSSEGSASCSCEHSSLIGVRKRRSNEKPASDLELKKRFRLSSSTEVSGNGRDNVDIFQSNLGEYIKDTTILVQKLLGKGGFGYVYQIQRRETGLQYAVKQAQQGLKVTLREVEVHNVIATSEMFSDSLLRCYKCIDHGTKTLFVMDLMECDLMGLMMERCWRPVETDVFLRMAKQVFAGLHHLNQLGYIHCDIKPENIMVEKSSVKDIQIKISDFGCCLKPQEVKRVEKIGTLSYRAPEMLLGLPKDERVDTWSAGCTLWFLYTGKHLFSPKYPSELLDQIDDLICLPLNFKDGSFAKKNLNNFEEKVSNTVYSQYTKRYMAKARELEERAKKTCHNARVHGKTNAVDEKITNVLVRLIQPNASIRLNSVDTYNLLGEIQDIL